jgi:hypothetical protein
VVLAGVVDKTGGVSALGAPSFQILIEERQEHVAAELERGVAVPAQRPEIVARRSSPGCAARDPSPESSLLFAASPWASTAS